MPKGLVLWMSPVVFQPPGSIDLTGESFAQALSANTEVFRPPGGKEENILHAKVLSFYGFPLLIDHLSPTLAILAVSDARRGPASAFGSKEVPCGKRGGQSWGTPGAGLLDLDPPRPILCLPY